MASIYKHGKRWRAQVLVDGQRQGRVFDTKSEASQWALSVEADGRKGPVSGKLVEDALRKRKDELVNGDGSRQEIARVGRMLDAKIAKRRLTELRTEDLETYRDDRLKLVSDASVRRELNLLRGLLRRCREEWKWMSHNPCKGFKAPKSPPSRGRRISEDEVKRVRHAFGIGEALHAETITNRVGLAFLLAIETAMRSGEIVGLTWPNVHLDKSYVHLPKTKNGDKRDVPLSPFAVELLKALPRVKGESCFLMNDDQRDANFRKWRNKAAVADLHFHDSRAEGIWRLSKKLDVLQLARVIGHRDINSLLIYYRESAEDMAAKLAA